SFAYFSLRWAAIRVQRKVSRPRGRNPEYLDTQSGVQNTNASRQDHTQTCQSGVNQVFPLKMR
ncbi:hypothetical protein ACSVIJ_23345, partial [Pseudomonas sp. NCHU5208]|uniref:hypothetical protein n=1 Tax=unclassified Pseudomonas TaxID=196821 RepID=UPI003F9A5E6A